MRVYWQRHGSAELTEVTNCCNFAVVVLRIGVSLQCLLQRTCRHPSLGPRTGTCLIVCVCRKIWRRASTFDSKTGEAIKARKACYHWCHEADFAGHGLKYVSASCANNTATHRPYSISCVTRALTCSCRTILSTSTQQRSEERLLHQVQRLFLFDDPSNLEHPTILEVSAADSWPGQWRARESRSRTLAQSMPNGELREQG